MRVISGEYRRAKLYGAPSGAGAFRPTSDRVRENTFNVLGPRLPGADFLDLFAGTGAAGIEALSRGARRATFVENSPESLKVLRLNVAGLGLSDVCTVVARDAVAFSAAGLPGAAYDVVYADPPYNAGLLPSVLENLGSGKLLKPGAIVVTEHNRRPDVERFGLLELTDTRKYGKTVIAVWKLRGEGGGEEWES